MRKFAVGLMALVLAAVITCDAANAGRHGFFGSPVLFHQPSFFPQPSFFHQPSFFPEPSFFHQPFFFRKPFFGNRTFFIFSFPVIFAPYYPTYYPLYYPYYPSYDYGGGYAPTASIQQAPEPAAPQVWYYCDPLKGCYPCAQSCRAGWYQVSTTPPPPPNASQP